ncbi:MAG: ABC transporter substrate-binding protein, partial [Desulfobulbaceae bacterium]|nr:ABC transporter substrate-binding protein [Desulfobulbaceae bacterium]
MFRLISFLIVYPCLFILLISWGCHRSPEPEIRIGTNVWPGYEPLYLAKEHGYFEGAGIRLVEYPSASEVIRGFKNQNLEAAALTLDEAIYLRQTDNDLVIVLVMDISNGGDVIIAQPGINDFSDIKGKTIAVESSALGAYFISRALEIHSMTIDEVNIKHQAVNNHEEIFNKKDVDAVVTFEPVRTKLLAGGGKVVFSSKDIPGEIMDVLVVRKKVLAKKGGRLTKLVNGWFLALDDIKTRPEKSAAILARRLKVTPSEVLDSYEGIILPLREENRQLLAPDNG